jgi:DNA-binding XRE family transcriptional regulator
VTATYTRVGDLVAIIGDAEAGTTTDYVRLCGRHAWASERGVTADACSHCPTCQVELGDMGQQRFVRLVTAMRDIARIKGAELRRHRRMRGWTQVQLAAASALSQEIVSGLERGHRLGRPETWDRITAALDAAQEQTR